jgi:hypothetical protein
VAYGDEAKFRSLSKTDWGLPKYYGRTYEAYFRIKGVLEIIFEALTSQKPKLFGYASEGSGIRKLLPEEWLSWNIEDILSFDGVMFNAQDVREAFKTSGPKAGRVRVPLPDVKRMYVELKRVNGGDITITKAYDLLKAKGVRKEQVRKVAGEVDHDEGRETRPGPRGPREKRDGGVRDNSGNN